MQLQLHGRGLRTAAVLSLAGLFLVLAIGTALLESGVYRRTGADAAACSTRRTALSYLTNQVRRADEQGRVAIGGLEGVDALYLYEDGYVTCLYCFDGALRELYAEPDSGLTAADGVALLELSSLSIHEDEGRLLFSVTDGEGHTSSVTVTPRCGVRKAG